MTLYLSTDTYSWTAGADYCRDQFPGREGGHLLRFENAKQERRIVSELLKNTEQGESCNNNKKAFIKRLMQHLKALYTNIKNSYMYIIKY